MSVEIDDRFLADLRAVRARITDSFAFCGFLGKHGSPFSWYDPDGPHVENRAGLSWLIHQSLICRDQRDGKETLICTRLLLDRAMTFFGMEPTS